MLKGKVFEGSVGVREEILIIHGQFPWVKMDKSYHHLPCRKTIDFS